MPDKVEKMFGEYYAAMSAHEVDTSLSCFTDDCVYEDVPLGVVSKGKQEVRAFFTASFTAIPDLKMERTALFVAGDRAASEWVLSGTQTADLPGLPATHRSFSVRGASIIELREGRIKRVSDYWSLATFLQQVGLMPEAPAQ